MRRSLLVLALLLSPWAQAADWLYLTVPGDTLIGIGQQYLKDPKDWPKVQIENKVADPRRLPANTRIRIPVELLKVSPAPAVVSHVQGNVRVKPPNEPYAKLAVGDRITGGETVLTGPNSFASFKLADGSTLSQQSSTRLVFGRLAAYGKTGMVSTELELQGGRLEANAAAQLAPGGGFKVKTPVAVAGLRGTAFRLNMDEDAKVLKSEVLEGQVGVSAWRKEVVVSAGQGTLAESGKPPAPARPLLPAPSVIVLPEKVRVLPLAFSWQPDEAARAWRAQVASDTDFQKIQLEALAAQPAVRWDEALPDGRYVLRLRAVDGDGLEGLNLDHPFELDVRPLAPQLVSPGAGERSYGGDITFSWTLPEEAHGFLLQTSPSDRFDREVKETRLDAVTRHVSSLPPGVWHWRMASLDDKGERHLWGKPSSFLVRPLPAAPASGEARTEGGKVHLAWLAVAGAERYQYELAKTGDMQSPLEQKTVDQTRAALDLRPGKYFWRVRGLEADGQAGAWSQASPIILSPGQPGALQARLEEEALIVAWQGEAPAYQLELARDPDYKQMVASQRFEQSGGRLDKPQPGKYWLRVIAMGDDGVTSTPSPSLEVEVKRAMPWWILLLLCVPFAL